MLASLVQKLETSVKWAILLLFSLLVLLVFTQVSLRYLFSTGFVWAEEGARFLFVWLMFLGIALGIYKQSHIAMTLFIDKLKHGKVFFEVLRLVLMFAFFMTLLVTSIEFMETGFGATSSVLNFEMGWVYFIIPIISAISLIFITYLVCVALNKNALLKGEAK